MRRISSQMTLWGDTVGKIVFQKAGVAMKKRTLYVGIPEPGYPAHAQQLDVEA